MPSGTGDLERRRLELALAWATVVAAVADSVMTYVGMRWFGTHEGSPVVAVLIHALGPAAGLAARTFIAVALLVLLDQTLTYPSLRRVGFVALALVNVAVIGWNLAVMWG